MDHLRGLQFAGDESRNYASAWLERVEDKGRRISLMNCSEKSVSLSSIEEMERRSKWEERSIS